MKLHQYLRITGESQRSLSRRTNVPVKSLNNIEAGSDAMGRTWDSIDRATGGKVTRADYFPDEAPLRAEHPLSSVN